MNQRPTITRAILVHAESEVIRRREPYDLATAARLADIHPDRIKYYCRIGLLQETPDPDRERYPFTDQSLYELRCIEYLRLEEGVNLRGIRIILDLARRMESLESALRFHQDS